MKWLPDYFGGKTTFIRLTLSILSIYFQMWYVANLKKHECLNIFPASQSQSTVDVCELNRPIVLRIQYSIKWKLDGAKSL